MIQLMAKKQSIVEIFTEVVDANEGKIAVLEKDRKLTYKELDQRSNHLAQKIIGLDIQPETMIGISNQRSIELIIGMLAIIKAGCSYVPINQEYPLKRLEYMISDTNMKYFLSFDKQHEKFQELGLELITFDDDESKETDILKSLSFNNSLAYVLYTSGTTGNPKGVMIEQKSIINLVLNTKTMQIKEDNIVAQFSNPSFDAATYEIWGALLNGATLYILSDKYTSFEDWKEAIRIGKVDIAFFTTGLFNAIVDEDPLIFKGLKKIIIGGEKISAPNVKKLKQSIKNISLINGYGPTECTTFTTFHEIQNDDLDEIPIGKPLENVHVKIFSEDNMELSHGQTGEICVSGQGIMRGYLGKPELTDQVIFIDQTDQTKWYKTGDYGICLNDGTILYKGRKDNQIKIRGFRIELNEIQEKLDKYHAIDSSVVLVKNINNEHYIVAYYKHNGDQEEIMEQKLKEYLSNELPDYMIPQFFVHVHEFPLNMNGKVDKKVLLKMDLNQNHKHTSTTVEDGTKKKEVLEIWRNVIGNENLGLDDNFFENGGHSILATKLIYILKESILPDATLQLLMENSTVNQFVDAIETESAGNMEEILKNDAILDHKLKKNIAEISVQPVNNEGNILLTGGTGFLGAHLLSQLLTETKHVKIYCLVRFPSKGRIKDTLTKYNLWKNEFQERIDVIEGDFGMSQFGLSDVTYEKISNDVAHIYHMGAETNFFEPYHKAKVPNVDGVIEVIKLASTNKRKNIYYASTLAVLTGDRIWDEHDELIYTSDLTIGYNQSKWVAEKLLIEAKSQGLGIDIYRLGRISAHSSNGLWNQTDLLYKVIETFIVQHVLPFKEEVHFELMPVDFVSEFIYKASRVAKDKKFGIYHVFNDQKVSSDMVITFFEKYQLPYQEAGLEEWLEYLKQKTLSNHQHSLSALSQLIDESTELKETEVSQTHTKKELEKLSMTMPEIDFSYVENFMKHMLK